MGESLPNATLSNELLFCTKQTNCYTIKETTDLFSTLTRNLGNQRPPLFTAVCLLVACLWSCLVVTLARVVFTVVTYCFCRLATSLLAFK